MGENVGAMFFLSLGMIVVTVLIIGYKLKKNSTGDARQRSAVGTGRRCAT